MQRSALIAGAVVLAVLAFLVLRPKNDSSSSSKRARTADRTHSTTPATTRLVVVKGQPVGGVKRIVLKSGDQARIVVSTQDTKSEVHLHGYDIEREMAPGKPVTFSFPAKLEGIFTMELHATNTTIAKVEVQP